MGATENEELNEEGLPPPIVVGAITGTDADDNSSALKNAGNDKTGEKFCSRLPYVCSLFRTINAISCHLLGSSLPVSFSF